MTSVKERVAAGAAFLDERVHDWYTRVDPETLDVSSGEHCPIAQTHGNDFLHGCRVLGIPYTAGNHPQHIALGFIAAAYASKEYGKRCEEANAAWVEEIAKRRRAR
jgi:hypothetical protein